MVTFINAEVTGYLFYPLLAATVVVNPLQGFFNALIYIRPRYIRYKEGLRRVSSSDGRNDTPPRIPSNMQCLRSAVDLSALDDEDELEQLESDDDASGKEVQEKVTTNAVDRTEEWQEQNQSEKLKATEK